MKIFNKFFGLYRTLLYLAIILYLGIALGPMAAGIKSYVVQSGSMEPKIETGSLAYIQKAETNAPLSKLIEYKDIEIGDIIAFTKGEDGESITVVHRVTDIDENGNYITKGDNNDTADLGYVSPDQVVGHCLFSIPKLGYFTAWLQTKKGIIVAIILGLIALISSFISDTDDNIKTKKENDNESEIAESIPAETIDD